MRSAGEPMQDDFGNEITADEIVRMMRELLDRNGAGRRDPRYDVLTLSVYGR